MENSTYIVNAASEHEAARLIIQDRAFTTQTPEPFLPEQWEHIHSILDIGTGTGGWLITRALEHPASFFTGIDTNSKMLELCRLQATQKGLKNIEFLLMDATQPLQFEAESFDLVHLRSANSFLPLALWKTILDEIYRILRPHGICLINEFELAVTTSAAMDEWCAKLTQAMMVGHGAFSPSGRSSGFSIGMPRLLRNAHFPKVQEIPYIVTFSHTYNSEDEFRLWKEDMNLTGRGLIPFMTSTGVSTEEELLALIEEALDDCEEPEFMSRLFMMLMWGTKGV